MTARTTPGKGRKQATITTGTTLDGIRGKVFLDRYALKGEDGTPLEQHPEQMWRRVAAGIAAVEPTVATRTEWTQKFYDLLSDFKFVPGGRILSGAGTGHEVTFYNCYVVGIGEDPLDASAPKKPMLDPDAARPAFFGALAQMTDIMARSGGVGMNLSALPPRGTPIPAPERGRNGTVRPTVALSLDHPDVGRLLDEKDTPSLAHVDVAVIVPPEFDRVLTDDADWTPRWEHITGETVKARDLWARVTAPEGRRVAILRPDSATLTLDDSREAIVAGAASAAQSLYHGETPVVDFSPLRPKGAYIKTVNGTSSGPVAWMYLYDAVARADDGASPAEKGVIWFGEIASVITGKTIQQGGSRRGALMIMIDDDHPDIEEFIAAKRIDPETKRPVMIEHANMSLCIGDAFMEAVKADLPWDLKWQGKVVRTVRARDIWDQICEAAWLTAEPGVVFMERYQKRSNTWYWENIRCVNPCVTGETLIYTGAGLYPAAELAEIGAPVNVTSPSDDGVSFRQASHVFPTGVKPVYRLTTHEGYSVRLTADHKVLTTRGWKEARQLTQGDRIKLLNGEGGFGLGGSEELGRVLGWLVGDGCINSNRGKGQPSVVLSFWGGDRALAPAFAETVNRLVAAPEGARQYQVGVVDIEGRDESRVSSVRLMRLLDPELVHNKLQVPPSVPRGARAMQRGFLQSLFSADGSVQGSQEKGVSVRLSSSYLPLLEGVQRLLLNFGIASTLYTNRRQEMARPMPDGKGGQKEYVSKAQHELAISRANLPVFAEQIGFLQARKQEKLLGILSSYKRALNRESFVATFKSLVPDGEEMVYDLTEPESHLFVCNGLVLHNCGEQGLPPGGVCNLGAINLACYVDDDGRLMEAELARDAAHATRFLDDVIDATPYFSDLHVQMQREGTRRTGLGTMGLADALIKMRLAYGSQESQDVIERIYRVVRDAAYQASVELAKEKGPCGGWSKDPAKYAEGWFIQRLPQNVQDGIKEHGIRNGVLLTQAPTGTTSLLAGVSSGIEPVYDFAMKRVDRLGEHIMYHPLLQEWMDAHPGEERPAYFVGAKDLTPEEHVVVQAKVQEYTDSSISKTSNAPHDHTIDDVKRLYTLAYDLGCKGVTYYRDGSRDAVLSSVTEAAPKAEARTSATTPDDGAVAPAIAPAAPVAIPAAQVPAPIVQEAPAAAGLPAWMLEGRLKRRPNEMGGFTRNVTAPEGKVNITINSDDEGPLEVFINVSRSGSDVAALAEALGRLVSLQLRLPSTMSQEERLRQVANQLKGIGGSRSIGFGVNRVLSLPDAVAQAIYRHLEEHPAAPAPAPAVSAAQLTLPVTGPLPASPAPTHTSSAAGGPSAAHAAGTANASSAATPASGVSGEAAPASSTHAAAAHGAASGTATPSTGGTATPSTGGAAVLASSTSGATALGATSSAAPAPSAPTDTATAAPLFAHANGTNGHAAAPAPAAVLTGNLCPQCGSSGAYVYEEGCKKCHFCGYSEC